MVKKAHHFLALCTPFLLLPFCAYAQKDEKPVSVGVIGGVQLNDPFQANDINVLAPSNIRYSFANHRYVIGPVVQFKLPLHLGLEFDALYRRYGYTSSTGGVDTIADRATVANTWEFPVLLKFRVFGGPLSPFLLAGPNFRYIAGANQNTTLRVFPGNRVNATSSLAQELENRFAAGFSAGGGISVGPRYLRVEPQFRYSRWGWENFVSSPADIFKSNNNQVDFLLELRF